MAEAEGPGRPPHEPTAKDRETASIMIAAGIPHEKIARCLGIHFQTFTKHYADEIATAAELANSKVAGTLFRRATNENDPGGVTAAIWWTKSRMGWKDTTVNEVTGKDGQPLFQMVGPNG